MTRVRFTTSTLCLVFVVAGITAGQQQEVPMTPVTAALRLSSNLEKDSNEYERATQAIASSYWRRGDYESALALSETLGPTEQGLQLHYFAFSAIGLRQYEPARSALNRALKLVMTEDEDSRDFSLIRDFARRAIEIDDRELALKFTEALDDSESVNRFILVLIAEASAKRGEKDKAIALLDRALKLSDVVEPEERYGVMVLLAMSVKLSLALGEKDRPTILANRANELLLAIQDPDYTDRSLVALSFARLGEVSRARSLLSSFDDGGRTDTLLARTYEDNGDEAAAVSALDQARAILESTSEEDQDRSYALDGIARAYLRLGRLNDAFGVLRGIHNDYQLQRLATDLAGAFAAKARSQDASATLDFAYSQFRKIVSEKSEDIPSSASGSKARTKSHGLIALGEKYIEIGDLDGAEAAAMAIDQPQYKASLLAKVAVACAKAGDQSRAKSLLAMAFKLSAKSEPYSHDEYREAALLKVAEAYAESGFKEESATVVLRLLREMRDGENSSGTIECLFEVGMMAEAKGVHLNQSIQKMLKQVVKKVEEDN